MSVNGIQTSTSSAASSVLAYDWMHSATLSMAKANDRYCADSHLMARMIHAGRWKMIRKRLYSDGMSAQPGSGRKQVMIDSG